MSAAVFRVSRTAALVPPATGVFRAGWAEVPVTPPPGLALAGYSTDSPRATHVTDPLHVKALVLEDGRGERVAFCAADLFAASRFVQEMAAARTGPAYGVGPHRLVLLGTHTHTGPGNHQGAPLYDHVAQRDLGFDADLAAWLADRVARAVGLAADALAPARLGLGVRPVWGLARCASLPAFRRNPEAATWHDPGAPGEAPATDLPTSEARRCVDPRLKVLSVLDAGGRVRAVFGVFPGHNTTLGNRHRGYSADCFGAACAEARRRLDHAPFVALAAGPGADASLLDDVLSQGPALQAHVGRVLGDALARAASTGRVVEAPTVEVRFGEMTAGGPGDRRVGGAPDTTLADTWCFGLPALGGSEDGPSALRALARPGITSRAFPPEHPQHPKAPALGPAQGWLGRVAGLAAPSSLPLHVVRLGDVALATVPGEPSATTGWRIERSLRDLPGIRDVLVTGYAGDYAGYFTTAEEYVAQCYEGASTLFGRNQSRHLVRRLVEVALSPPPAAPEGEIGWRVPRVIRRFSRFSRTG